MTSNYYDVTKDLDKVVTFYVHGDSPQVTENVVTMEKVHTIEDTEDVPITPIDISKSAKDILSEVGENKELAVKYIEAEKTSDKPRVTLIKKLNEIAQ